jgi:hypothetical protein
MHNTVFSEYNTNLLQKRPLEMAWVQVIFA